MQQSAKKFIFVQGACTHAQLNCLEPVVRVIVRGPKAKIVVIAAAEPHLFTSNSNNKYRGNHDYDGTQTDKQPYKSGILRIGLGIWCGGVI